MNIKRLVLLSLGVYSLSMPLMVQAADPVISITQQEQLQKTEILNENVIFASMRNAWGPLSVSRHL